MPIKRLLPFILIDFYIKLYVRLLLIHLRIKQYKKSTPPSNNLLNLFFSIQYTNYTHYILCKAFLKII